MPPHQKLVGPLRVLLDLPEQEKIRRGLESTRHKKSGSSRVLGTKPMRAVASTRPNSARRSTGRELATAQSPRQRCTCLERGSSDYIGRALAPLLRRPREMRCLGYSEYYIAD